MRALEDAAVSESNSTTTPLGPNGVFEGVFENVLPAAAVTILIHSDRPSATNGIVLQWSADGVTVDDPQSFSYAGAGAENALILHSTRRAAFFRIRYTNTSLAQASFRLQVILRPDIPQCSIVPAGIGITSQNDALVTNSVMVGRLVSNPTQLVMPLATGDPFWIVARPPNSGVLFKRAIAASTSSQQLDFFGIIGANRDAMSVHNDSNGTLLLNQGDPASASAFTERLEPGETWNLPLSWVLYGGPVHGIWLPPPEATGPVKFAPVSAALPTNIIVPLTLSKKLRVLNYVLTAKEEVRATWRGLVTPLSGAMFLKETAQPITSGGLPDSPLFETLLAEPLTLILSTPTLVTGHLAYVEVETPALSGFARVLELT